MVLVWDWRVRPNLIHGMNNINIQGLKKKDEFLIRCFERFGSMNKNDYEVELMHLLLENDFAGKSDYFISTQLQIPVSKVKRLRYEADLKHPKGAEDYKQLFLQTLQTASFKEDGHLIQFAIHDKSLREYLSSQLEAAGSYYDTSFNEIIISKFWSVVFFLCICGVFRYEAADVNADNKVTITDAVAIVNMILAGQNGANIRETKTLPRLADTLNPE